MKATLVSVIIPTFNRSAYLREAIESVLCQTHPTLELIVVDDGSTDDTGQIVQSYLQDPRVKYVYQANHGRSAARNHGASLARGDWLGFLDSDDRYLPSALEAHLKILSECPHVGMTIGGYRYIDAEGRGSEERHPWEEGGSLDLSGWLFNCYAIPGTILIRHKVFDEVEGFDSTREMAEDWDLFLRTAQMGCPMGWAKEVVCTYRLHSDGSIRAVAKHRDSSLITLTRFLESPGIDPEIRNLGEKAKAWVYVLFAKKAFATGEMALAEHDLQKAIGLDPELIGRKRVELLEFLFSPHTGGVWEQDTLVANVLAQLPSELRAQPVDIRRALARVEMAQFFRSARKGARADAAKHLQTGLKLDPGWLINRGVLSFCLQEIANRAG
jgi:glycosyltransferase involved in cell wall biosynthesis